MSKTEIQNKIETLENQRNWLSYSDAPGTARKMDELAAQIRSLQAQL